jgi:hypothetical protein
MCRTSLVEGMNHPDPLLSKSKNRKKTTNMTDDPYSMPANGSVDDDDEGLFEAAKETFPGKEDLKDRLVVMYPTGKTGERKGENGDPYAWYETVTVVLDDGPKGYQHTVIADGIERENLVPSVVEQGPQILKNFQWSAGGIAARLAPIYDDPKVRSMVGRINRRPPSKKGMAPPWGIAKPTDEDMATARRFTEVCKKARQEVREARQREADKEAF